MTAKEKKKHKKKENGQKDENGPTQEEEVTTPPEKESVEEDTTTPKSSKKKAKKKRKSVSSTTDESSKPEHDTMQEETVVATPKKDDIEEENAKSPKSSKQKAKKDKKRKSLSEESQKSTEKSYGEPDSSNKAKKDQKRDDKSDQATSLEKESESDQEGKSPKSNPKEKSSPKENEPSSTVAKRSIKEIRAARREERKRLMDAIPKADEHGIAYTKQQLRRMRKRVARGLDPIETQEEKQERLREEAEMKREEEAELAGILYQKDELNDDNSDEDGGEDVSGDDEKDKDDDDENDQIEEESVHEDEKLDPNPRPTKKRRSKPVPSDYTCLACQNKHTPKHWIYDCPSKVTKRGTNQVSKKVKGLHEPDARKVFVSGLPFDATRSEVTKLFNSCGKVVSCKLVTFEDTGRCKGQAYLSFETEEGAQNALKQNGSVIENNMGKEKEGKSKSAAPANRRKDLKLKVTKVLSRAQTKKRKQMDA